MNDVSIEDRARADHYAVLSRMFYAPPDAQFLAALAAGGNVERDSALACAWNALSKAAAEATAEAVREEYETLFVGVGKPRVVLYASWHRTGFMMEQPLVRLRADLAALGLGRSTNVAEPEDHFAALMDVMRHLIMDPDRAEAARLALQQRFFVDHIDPWYEKLCDAIDNQQEAHVYSRVSGLARVFMALEKKLL